MSEGGVENHKKHDRVTGLPCDKGKKVEITNERREVRLQKKLKGKN
jgi:hypothetical protein